MLAHLSNTEWHAIIMLLGLYAEAAEVGVLTINEQVVQRNRIQCKVDSSADRLDYRRQTKLRTASAP